MGVIVTFDYQQFITRYPEFAYLSEPLIMEYYLEATIFHRNDGGGPVRDPTAQLVYLNMMTAHIAALNAPTAAGGAASNLVGRISTASEGSVSVGTENPYPPGAPSWYQQTKYGSAYWNATKPYRTARYIRGWVRNFNPWPIQ